MVSFMVALPMQTAGLSEIRAVTLFWAFVTNHGIIVIVIILEVQELATWSLFLAHLSAQGPAPVIVTAPHCQLQKFVELLRHNIVSNV